MDVIYIEQMITTLETKRNEHCCQKHAEHGESCIKRFSRMIDNLKEKISQFSGGSKPVISARGDELKKAGKLNAKAKVLEEENDHLAAEKAQNQARKIVASELNEMDGFPR